MHVRFAPKTTVGHQNAIYRRAPVWTAPLFFRNGCGLARIEVRDKIRAAEKLLVERKRFGLWELLCEAGALAASALISIRDAWLRLPGNDGLYNFGAHVAVSPLLR
jgi:hypothetical protein